MNKLVKTKICGLRTEEDVKTAVSAGASFVGFNHFPKSPRHVEPDKAEALARLLPEGVKAVSLLVDPPDEEIVAVSPWADYIQLHGEETPERVREIATLCGKPVIKALPLAESGDLEKAADYQGIAEILLFDAKPPKSSDLPGGNAVPFDWHILAGVSIATPWMLSGGLDAANVKEAICITGATMVDVSSGVEEERGVKSPIKIRAFLEAVKEVND